MKIVIVDSDVRGDHRVQLSILESSEPVVLVDIRDSCSVVDWLWACVASVPLLLRVLMWPVKRQRLLKVRLGARVDSNWGSGFLVCLGLLIKAMVASAHIRRIATGASGGVALHAHDLYCGVAAAIARDRREFPLVYDAHELEIHRNRRVGWLRALVEHGLEQFVLSRCTELRVVNAAIRDVMDEWYKMPEIVRIVYNDFYPHHSIIAPSSENQPSIVYVGQGVNGRELECLDDVSISNLFQIHVYLLGARLPSHIKGVGWKHGHKDYEASLVLLSCERRCLMWCCLENRCLSYELATPNKFFQALAIGMPVIASEGTYLAKVVIENGLGTLFNGSNIAEIRQNVLSNLYERWVSNVLIFRDRLRKGEVSI